MSNTLEKPKTKFIIELDFDADPETTRGAIIADFNDMAPAFKEPVAFDGSTMVFEGLADAFTAYLRYGAIAARAATQI